MRILLTGAKGFLGRSIQQYFLSIPGCEVRTLGRSADSNYRVDLATETPSIDERFDMVIHAAGKAHVVPKTPEESQAFFDVNEKGTLSLLHSLSSHPPGSFVFISTVAVYGVDEGTDITEDAPLSATDPYGKSKILAEQHVNEWCGRHGVKSIVLRLPLLIGSGAPGNLGAMVKGIRKGYYFNIGKGDAKKSMVLVTDVAPAIHALIGQSGVFNLTDGVDASFSELSQTIAQQLGKKSVMHMPYALAKLLALAGDLSGLRSAPINSKKIKKITSNLTFNSSRLQRALPGWRPSPVVKNFRL